MNRLPLLLLLVCAVACGSEGKNPKNPEGGAGGGGTGGKGSGPGPLVGEGGPTPPGTVGQISGVKTALPELPVLANVAAIEREDSVGIAFHPFDGAADYRVYALPKDADITAAGDGSVVVKNAFYRCSGMRQTTDLENNLNKGDPLLHPVGKPYNWKAQIDADPKLGYVYLAPADDRIPVHVIAGYQVRIDGQWMESRYKVYTTDDKERDELLAKNWRDDGIAFYVPAAASDATHTIYSARHVDGGETHNKQDYITDAQLDAHKDDSPKPAFQVLTDATPGTEPLLAVHYVDDNEHAELAVGNERFKRASNQGNGPIWHLEYSGITEPTTLVVEALATGCPFQGFLSPQHLEAPPHQTLFTLDDLQAASKTGEVFINGQYDVKDFPKAIARSFVKVEPKPHVEADWDWWEGFTGPDDISSAPATDYPACKNGDSTCGRWTSSKFDFQSWSVDNPGGVPVFTRGVMLGQLWTVFDDWMQDVTGKLRFTALQKASVDADRTKFLHVTWSVDIVGTGRRYPQLIVSDRSAPVQDGFIDPEQNTLLVQTITGPAMRLETQAIHGLAANGKPWDINNQAPSHIFIGEKDDQTVRNIDPIFEHAGMDRQTTFDAYISNERLYVYFDGQAAGCTLFPEAFKLGGEVSVTFGDVIYHEGAEDEEVCQGPRPYTFLNKHQCQETRRHFDDLGFKSGVKPPAWDETKLPCLPY